MREGARACGEHYWLSAAKKTPPTTRFYFLPERVRLHPSARAVKVIESDSKTGGGGVVGFLLPKGSEIDGNPDRFGIVSDF